MRDFPRFNLKKTHASRFFIRNISLVTRLVSNNTFLSAFEWNWLIAIVCHPVFNQRRTLSRIFQCSDQRPSQRASLSIRRRLKIVFVLFFLFVKIFSRETWQKVGGEEAFLARTRALCASKGKLCYRELPKLGQSSFYPLWVRESRLLSPQRGFLGSTAEFLHQDTGQCYGIVIATARTKKGCALTISDAFYTNKIIFYALLLLSKATLYIQRSVSINKRR